MRTVGRGAVGALRTVRPVPGKCLGQGVLLGGFFSGVPPALLPDDEHCCSAQWVLLVSHDLICCALLQIKVAPKGVGGEPQIGGGRATKITVRDLNLDSTHERRAGMEQTEQGSDRHDNLFHLR